MNYAAGVLGILFALLHGGPSLARLRQPIAARGSHDVAAVPKWARILWLVLALITLIGSVVYLASATVGPAALITVGGLGIWLLAIANGLWIHGRPTFSHHVIRGVILALLLVLAFLGLK